MVLEVSAESVVEMLWLVVEAGSATFGVVLPNAFEVPHWNQDCPALPELFATALRFAVVVVSDVANKVKAWGEATSL